VLLVAVVHDFAAGTSQEFACLVAEATARRKRGDALSSHDVREVRDSESAARTLVSIRDG
jgi:hypothetical protein